MNRDENGRFCKSVKVKIKFCSWVERAALEYECTTIKDAIESAVKDGTK